MTPAQLEIRAGAYLLAAIILVAFGVRLGMHHVQAQWDIDKAAQAQVVLKAQADVIAFQAQRDKLQNEVEQTHAQLIQNGVAVTGTIAASLRSLEAAARAGALSPSVGNPGQLAGTGASPGSVAEFSAAISRVGEAVTAVSTACTHDSAELTAILALQPAQRP